MHPNYQATENKSDPVLFMADSDPTDRTRKRKLSATENTEVSRTDDIAKETQDNGIRN